MPQYQTGYCTNVHAGRNLEQVLENLRLFSGPVRDRLELDPSNGSGDRQLGVGLWFSEVSAREALEPANCTRLQHTLDELGLIPYTLNGFPQGDFHQRVVKHAVYLPTWWEPARLTYTQNLISLLDRLLPHGSVGSISTLPIAWGTPNPSDEELARVCKHWLTVALGLDRMRQKSDRYIVLAIEPEPGCYFSDSRSVREFFVNRLWESATSEDERRVLREHITVCHDICHAAVMGEDQAAELRATIDAGIQIGKVQVSSAVRVDWSTLDAEQRQAAWTQLQGFVEERYLHQTTICTNPRESTVEGKATERASSRSVRRLVEDLPLAIAACAGIPPDSEEWRIHFHVPIFLKNLGALLSTQEEIARCLEILVPHVGKAGFKTGHWEVETYAWTVLPESLRESELSEGIAKEMNWFEATLGTVSTA